MRHFQNSEGRHVHSDLPRGTFSPASVRSVKVCVTGPSLLVKSAGSTPVQCVDHLVPLCSGTFFFHEYGRRVGMVPRSSHRLSLPIM